MGSQVLSALNLILSLELDAVAGPAELMLNDRCHIGNFYTTFFLKNEILDVAVVS